MPLLSSYNIYNILKNTCRCYHKKVLAGLHLMYVQLWVKRIVKNICKKQKRTIVHWHMWLTAKINICWQICTLGRQWNPTLQNAPLYVLSYFCGVLFLPRSHINHGTVSRHQSVSLAGMVCNCRGNVYSNCSDFLFYWNSFMQIY